MAHQPPIPDGKELVQQINGWKYEPNPSRNAHLWTGQKQKQSLGVFTSHFDSVRLVVFDDRARGFCNRITLHERPVEGNDDLASAVGVVIDQAVDWMKNTAPSDWEHPEVEPAVFDPPVGFVLDSYYIEEREYIVCYRQKSEQSALEMAGRPASETQPSIETRKYLYIETWRGSGNSTVALAPWRRPHDEVKHEVVNPPEGCGLEIALKLARDWARETTGETREQPATGQTGLQMWANEPTP